MRLFAPFVAVLPLYLLWSRMEGRREGDEGNKIYNVILPTATES